MKKTIGVFLVALVAQQTAHAQIAAPRCITITSLDLPITVPGSYCLTRTLIGPGLVIDTGDVTIDLHGFSIINSRVATGDDTSLDSSQVGIKMKRVGGNLDGDITVRNGSIVGFDYGVRLGHPAGVRGTLLVENLLVRGSKLRGISVLGFNAVTVRNNVVTETVGPTTYGIEARGRENPDNGGINSSVVTIEGNRVDNTRAAGPLGGYRSATGIGMSEAGNAIITGNIVTNVSTSDTTYSAVGIGIFLRHPYVATVTGNTILNPRAVTNSVGIQALQGGQVGYTGPLGSGRISSSKIYGCYYGIFGQSDTVVDGSVILVRTFMYTSNVVSGAATNYAYWGGILGKGNRTE